MTNLEWLIKENKLCDFLSDFEDTIVRETKHNLKEPAPLFTGKYPGLSRQGLSDYRTFYVCSEWLKSPHLDAYVSIDRLKTIINNFQISYPTSSSTDCIESIMNAVRIYAKYFNPKDETTL